MRDGPPWQVAHRPTSPCRPTDVVSAPNAIPTTPEAAAMRTSLPRPLELRADGPDGHLAIYLRDHLAGSVGGLALMARSLRNNRGSVYAPPLRRLRAETLLDRAALERVAASLGVEPSRLKQGGAWLVEKSGRAKRNGQLVGYSSLARLWELEQLGAAVSTKTDLWTVLADERMSDRVPADVDATAVLARCRSHVELVEDHRRRAAVEAFVPARA